MPRFRFSSTPDNQIDPFNAGDPVMPGGEPDPLDDNPHAEPLTFADEPSYAPHGDKGGVPHKPSDNYQAPTTGGHDYDAPSIDAPTRAADGQGGKRWRRAAATLSRKASSDKRGGSGCAIAILVFFLIFGGIGDALVGCVSTFMDRTSEGFSSFFDEGFSFGNTQPSDDPVWEERNWREYADELDLAAGDAFERRMGVLLADPSADPATGFVTSAVDGYVLNWVGYGTDALGIDAHAAAVWALSDLTYEIESVYAYDDGTATIYLDTEAPSLVALVDAADDDISAYLIANDLSIWDGSDPDELSDAQRAETSAIWAEALDRTEELDESFLSVELTRTDGVWTVDEASLEEMLRKSVGLY